MTPMVNDPTYQLHRAIKRHDINAAAKALSDGADIHGFFNNPSFRTLSPICEATQETDVEMVKFLHQQGASLNLNAGAQGIMVSPLHLLANKDKHIWAMEIASYCLRAGANPDAQDHDGQTPLHMAAKYENPEYMQKLLEFGANVRLINNANRNIDSLSRFECKELVQEELKRLNTKEALEREVIPREHHSVRMKRKM